METKNVISSGISGEFKLLFNLSQDMICVMNADACVLEVNQKFKEIVGFTAAELPCNALNYLLLSEDYYPVLNRINTAHPEKQFSFLTSIFCADNTYKKAECFAVKNPNGQIILSWRLSGSEKSSVIEQNQAKIPNKNLTEPENINERRFKVLVQNGSDLLGILTVEGEYKYVSPSVSHILGNDPEFYIGKNAFEFIHPESIDYLLKEFETIKDHYKIELKPYRFLDSDGNWRWLETVVTNLLNDPAVNGIVVNSKDITSKKEFEDEKKQISGRLDNVLENFTDGLFIISKDWKITFFNPAAQKILRIPADKFINADYFDIFPEAVNLKFYREYKRAYEQNVSVNFQEFNPVLNRWFEVNAYPYDNSLTVIFRDITELRNKELTLALEKEVLEMNIFSRFNLKEAVDHLLKGIENIYPGMICSVLKLDPEGKKVYHLSSPSLPQEYIDLINGLEIGPDSGSCGTAAFLKKEIIADDIENNPCWQNYKHIVIPLGLKSCWSFPIITSDGKVIATFGVYHSAIKAPSDLEVKAFERVSTILQLLLENDKNQKEIEVSNERYKYTIAATNDTIWDWDMVSKQLYRGKGFEKFFNHDIGVENEISKNWEFNIHPKDRQRIINSLEEVVNNPEKIKWSEEYRFKKIDGTYATILDKGYVIRDSNKQAIRMVGAMQDITERRKNTEELRQSEENYKMLFSSNPTPMWTYDLGAGKFSMVNDAALALYGYTREEFLSLDLFSIRVEEEHARLRKQLNSKAFHEDYTFTSEWKYIKKDKTIVIVEVISNYFEINGGKYRLVAIKDVTEQKNAQIEITEQNTRLREIAQISSHEFRKPVASILGLVKLFDRENLNSKFNAEIIDYLEITANDLDTVIHTIVKKTWKEEN
ncbi:PAS domain S-box protein [Daejeonella oryzae]|uniref:PAS domain S-box protein n=1 Tax=Daejeonella oryzae TaxID=1122943 RepID=UPI00041B687E|nr:PAS domain S-box protein [Daejeonella oryzae]